MWKKLSAALIATATALAGTLLTVTPAHAGGTDAATPQQTRVLITDRDEATAATVETTSTDPFVRMKENVGALAQTWEIPEPSSDRDVRIVSAASGGCLQPRAEIIGPEGVFAIHERCGAGNDLWRIVASERLGLVGIVHVDTGFCLTHPRSTAEDKRLEVIECQPLEGEARDQLFRLVPVA